MRIKMTSLFVLFGLLASSALALAAAEPRYRGEFKFEPKVMHSSPITGQLEALFDHDVFQGLLLKLDQPVMGLSQVRSDLSWFNLVEIGGRPQLTMVFNLQGPPHTWFFVNVAYPNTAGGTTFDGTMFKARGKFEDLKAALKNGLPMKEGRPVAPTGWKAIGTSSLKN